VFGLQQVFSPPDSEVTSHWGITHLQLSLKALALDGNVTEGAPEEVLRAVTSAVSTVACDRQNDIFVLSLIREQTLEAV